MEAIENKGKNDKFTVGIVSCRTDVLPFFTKRGYKVIYINEFYLKLLSSKIDFFS